MKLAALGVVTIAIGIAFSLPGLIGIGAFWVVMGLVAREYKNRLEERTPATDPAVPPGTRGKLAVDGTSFAVGTALWLAIGVPSVVVGAFGIGIGSEHAGWRWLPIVVGGLALAIGVIGGLMYGLGSAVLAPTRGRGPTRRRRCGSARSPRPGPT